MEIKMIICQLVDSERKVLREFDVCPYSHESSFLKSQLGEIVMPMNYYDPIYSLNEMQESLNTALIEKRERLTWKYIHNEDEYVYVNYVDQSSLGCQHFQTNCLAICNVCQQNCENNYMYACNYCHDNALILNSNDDHKMIVEQLCCSLCSAIQSLEEVLLNNNQCNNCNEVLFHYYCKQCCVFIFNKNDQSNYNFFHCQKCNQCHQNKAESYQFCDKCQKCHELCNFDYHINNNDNECPICQDQYDNLFNKGIVLSCSHKMHYHCRQQQIQQNMVLQLTQEISKRVSQCPICRQPAFTQQEKILQQRYDLFNYLISYVNIEDDNIQLYQLQCNQCKQQIVHFLNIEKLKQQQKQNIYCPHCNKIINNVKVLNEINKNDVNNRKQVQSLCQLNDLRIQILQNNLICTFKSFFHKCAAKMKNNKEQSYQLQIKLLEEFFLITDSNRNIAYAAMNLLECNFYLLDEIQFKEQTLKIKQKNIDQNVLKYLQNFIIMFREVKEVQRLELFFE